MCVSECHDTASHEPHVLGEPQVHADASHADPLVVGHTGCLSCDVRSSSCCSVACSDWNLLLLSDFTSLSIQGQPCLRLMNVGSDSIVGVLSCCVHAAVMGQVLAKTAMQMNEYSNMAECSCHVNQPFLSAMSRS